MFPLFSWPFLSVLDLALVLTVIPKVKSSSVKEQEAPVAAVIETAPEKGGDDDGEVRHFYLCCRILCPFRSQKTNDKHYSSSCCCHMIMYFIPLISKLSKQHFMTSPFTFTSQVFYIFYENEETSDKGVKSGLDLQRYIHEEVDHCVSAMIYSPGGRKLCFSAILNP